MKKKRSKPFLLAWVFGVTSFVLVIILSFCGVMIVKLQRNNMFSRSILLENNYFMDQLMYDLSNDQTNQSTDDTSLNNIYADPLAGEYVREYLMYDEKGNLSIAAEVR